MTGIEINIADHLDAEHLAVFERIPPRVLDADDIPGTVAAIRAAGAARQAAAKVALPASVTIEDHVAPSANGGPDVPVRLYRSEAATTPTPAFYWIHGGGMVGGTVASTDSYCAWIADELGILVASVDYRLAPEHPYPAPLDDCEAGLRWLDHEAEALGIDRTRVGLGGGSAGAGLAAGLALLARDRGEIALAYQHLVYPMLDDRNETASSHAILDSRVWNRTCNHVGAGTPTSGASPAPRTSRCTRRPQGLRISPACRRRTSASAAWISSSTRTSRTRGHCSPLAFPPNCMSTRARSTDRPAPSRTPRSRVVGARTNSHRFAERWRSRCSLAALCWRLPSSA